MPWGRAFAALAAIGVAASVGVTAPASGADPTDPVRLAVAAPLTAPAGVTGLISSQALAQYTSPLGLLTRQLDAMYGRSVAIGVDPMIIASIRVLGNAAPATATTWLDRLSNAPNQVFPLAYADLDLTLVTQAGAGSIPVPTAFAGLDPTLFVPAAPEPGEESPTPTPQPTQPPGGTPTLEELLAWPYTVDDLAWPREDTVVGGDLPIIAAAEYDTVIVSSTNVARGAAATPTSTVGTTTILVSDNATSDAMTAAAAATDDATWAAAMQALFAALRSAAAIQPGNRPVVVATLDRGAAVVGSRLGQTLDALEASTAVTTISLTAALGSAPVEAQIVDAPQPADRVSVAQRVLAAEAEDRFFAVIASDPGLVSGPRRLAMLGVLSAAWEPNPAGWTAAAEEFRAASVALQTAVRVEETSQVNFFADKSVIPIPVTNDLDVPVTVYVTIDPNTPLLAVENSWFEVTVPPNSQVSAQVPVQAISNGRVTLTVSLSSAGGTGIGPTRLVQANVVAGWEGPVFTTLAVLVVAMFTFGIVRTILRRRRTAAADG